ncbi:tRNA pseudouridine(55) synthase TruB [Rossellomorea vietnamensis]|uniref:tRNA pseudouridine synthase B n=2 Tax=Rossellomorea TaxID=2837508 RepID=A0A5D4KMC0_9BACI|nr:MULTISPECIES: tRNA pseudouridine(55) synthase TruB [Rossellomorea]TYR77483.1 tRNA pseudouridine(55) synthase TruB [Rossellomorea vietnamensis]TYS82426.1 tRNA pseudouridine(55) synthase TruB [Rossellomorea aquimaris]
MNGILPLWKPRGMTSHDCVFKVRKILRTKKVGHTGTLDPEVTGVLPLCIGRGTKIAEYIMNGGKAYEGEVTIGRATTTEDAWGETVSEKKVSEPFSREKVLETLNMFQGEITQTPPMFSAVKVNGKRLYEYAREGKVIDRPSRKVIIHHIELLDDREVFEGESISFRFRVSCSKGTYIRTLAVEIGEKLGYPAHMSQLCRVRSAAFEEKDCVTFEELEELAGSGEAEKTLFPIETGISHLPKWNLSDTLAMKVKNGAVLEMPNDWPDDQVAMNHDGRTLAIYQAHPEKKGIIKPVKVLFND